MTSDVCGKCHPQDNNKAFAVGDRVEARYSNGVWYTATVSDARAGGNYKLDWDDKDTRERVKHSSEMRKKDSTEESEYDDSASSEVIVTAGKIIQQSLQQALQQAVTAVVTAGAR